MTGFFKNLITVERAKLNLKTDQAFMAKMRNYLVRFASGFCILYFVFSWVFSSVSIICEIYRE